MAAAEKAELAEAMEVAALEAKSALAAAQRVAAAEQAMAKQAAQHADELAALQAQLEEQRQLLHSTQEERDRDAKLD